MTTLSASVEPFILSDGTIDVVGGKSPFMGRAVLPLLVGLMAPLLLLKWRVRQREAMRSASLK